MTSGARRDAAVQAGVVASVTLMGLHLELKKRLADVAAGFSLQTEKGDQRAPIIADGWLPPKTAGGDEQFPFLILRPSSGNDTLEGADQQGSATVKIIIGTFSDDDAGWLDVALLIDAIRSDLGQKPTLEGTAFTHDGPLTWEIPEQQPRPQWFGTVTTIWNVSRPRRIDALED